MRRVLAGVAMAALLGASACSADSGASTVATSAPATTETLSLVGGGALDAARLDSGPLALWFWAPG